MRTLVAFLSILGAFAIGFPEFPLVDFIAKPVHGEDGRAADPPEKKGLVVHEMGVAMLYMGSDGKPIDVLPRPAFILPGFVENPKKYGQRQRWVMR
ncbi:MAG: hypothetical protein ACYTHM_08870 [Planctomycetota bacterium]|jgi:hypothetical protein